jgi:signal transduction histidine kinase
VEHTVTVNAQQPGIKIRVIGGDGQLLATSAGLQDADLADWRGVPGVAEGLAGRPSSGVARGVFARGDRLFDARPIRRAGRVLGVVRISLTLDRFEQELQRNLYATLFTALLVFLVCMLVSVAVARSIAEPIQAMRNFAVRVGSGHFGDKLHVHRKDELGELAVELSRMSEQLASVEAERRAFLANVAHELRTPVTNADVALHAAESGHDVPPEVRAEFTRAAVAELARLRHLVQELLELGRLEAGIASFDYQVVSLTALLDDTLQAMARRLEQRGLAVSLDVPGVYVRADAEKLTQVFMNLLENALKYADSDTTLFLTGHVKHGTVAVRLEDEGPGIDAEDLPHVFQEFFIGDRSRAGAGSGLGLAIAWRIVEAHGGNITAASPPGRGASFTVELPLARTPGHSPPEPPGRPERGASPTDCSAYPV